MRPITAADLMNPGVMTVREEMTVRELAAFLVENRISGAPVEGGDGRLVGVVSLVDVADATSGDELAPGRPSSFFAHGFHGFNGFEGGGHGDLDELELEDDELVVGDIMTPELFTIPADATVSEVAATMLKGHIHRLLVTRDDRVVGILSTSDLLGLLVQE